MINPFARPPACPVCDDTRMVTSSVRAREADVSPCPRCGADPHPREPESKESRERYDHFVRTRFIETSVAPAISQLDLTPEEFKTYQRLRDEHPEASGTTVLSWIEGQRYDPSKDEEFMRDAREHFRKWRADRDKADAEYRETHPYSPGDGRLARTPLTNTIKNTIL